MAENVHSCFSRVHNNIIHLHIYSFHKKKNRTSTVYILDMLLNVEIKLMSMVGKIEHNRQEEQTKRTTSISLLKSLPHWIKTVTAPQYIKKNIDIKHVWGYHNTVERSLAHKLSMIFATSICFESVLIYIRDYLNSRQIIFSLSLKQYQFLITNCEQRKNDVFTIGEYYICFTTAFGSADASKYRNRM